MKKMILAGLIFFIFLATAACAISTHSEPTEKPVKNPTDVSTTSPTEQQSESVREVFIAEGELTGLIDNNSFEAIIQGEATAFRLDDAPTVFEKKNVRHGDKLDLGYIINQEQQKIVQYLDKQ